MNTHDNNININMNTEKILYLSAPSKFSLNISPIALVIPHPGQEIPSMLLNIHGISIFNTNNTININVTINKIAVFIILFLLFFKIVSISIF